MTTPNSSGGAAILKNYWLPILLVVLVVIFIFQNTHDATLHFLMFTLTMPEWLSFTIVLLVGLVVGWFLGGRGKVKKKG